MMEQKESLRSSERNYGLDLLRIVAMLLIVTVHIYNQGGVADGIGTLRSFAGQSNLPMRILCMTAVNLYALISGYVLLESRFHPGRFLELWLQVVVIGIAECGIWSILSPEQVSLATWRDSLLPITQGEYWFFTAYAGVFMFSPVLKRGIRRLNERQAFAMMLGLFGLFSVGWLLGKLFHHDSFWLGGGNTTLWLIVLFVIGGCLKRSRLFSETKTWKLLLGAAGCLLAIWALRDFLAIKALPETVQSWHSLMLKYCNPPVLLLSICIFVLFSRIRPEGFTKKLIGWLSPLTFGVYLVHVHPAFWSWFEDRFVFLAELPGALILPAVLGTALILYLIFSLVDWLRSLLFRLVRVRKLCDRIERWLFRSLHIVDNTE